MANQTKLEQLGGTFASSGDTYSVPGINYSAIMKRLETVTVKTESNVRNYEFNVFGSAMGDFVKTSFPG